MVSFATIFYAKLMSTLDIMNNLLCIILVTFSQILHESRNHINNKGNIRSTMSQINEATNQLSIEGDVNFWRITFFGQLNF